ncbi:MAG TPA: glycoside hydrolase family 16 protein [Polyangiaceae bacterium]
MHRILRNRAAHAGVVAFLAYVGLLVDIHDALAVDINWKGYVWSVTDGGMAGVANGSPSNVSVDVDGYLHLKIQKNGNTWTAAELFTTTKLGFGTYQWQIDGPIDTFDKNVVLGLFPYGPAAGIGADGTNEIDIEYSRWGQANGPNGDWTNYPASGSTVGEFTYNFSLNGDSLSTSRFIWTKTSIEDFLLEGLQPLTSTAPLLKTWKYSPANPSTNIPQQALPLGMNLWCFDIPSDGKNVEIVIRDFQFLAEGTSPTGGGGASSTGGGGATSTGENSSGGRGNSTSSGGGNAGGRANSTGGVANAGAASANGGAFAIGGNYASSGANSRAGASYSVAGSGNRPQPAGGSVSVGGSSVSGGASSVIGTLSNGGATSTGVIATFLGGAPSYGGANVGGASSNVGTIVGGARSSAGTSASSSRAPSGGTASSRGQTSSPTTATQPETDDETSSGCSISAARGRAFGSVPMWLGALSLLVGRRLRRRSSL